MKFARIQRGRWLGLWTAMALLTWTPTLNAGGVVASATFEALKAALVGGGTVSFAVDGTFTFTETLTVSADTVISGDSHTITFSGNKAVRLFNVSTGAVLTLRTLTLTAGAQTGNDGLTGDDGTSNTNNGQDGRSGTDGENVGGGAIYNAGDLLAVNCSFLTNTVTGGMGGNGGNGGNGSLNGGNGGDAGDGGIANGGAIYNLGSLTLTNCNFTDNVATGGSAGNGGTNGSPVSHAGHGGKGGLAWGGAVYSTGTAAVFNCTFAYNVATGGDSTTGGASDDSAVGKNGPDGGEARGGSIHNTGNLIIVNSTLANSDAFGGNGGNGGDGTLSAGNGGDGGNASGGNLCNNGTAGITNVTIAGGGATGGTAGSAGNGSASGLPGSDGRKRGGNLANYGSLRLINTIIANPFRGKNADGSVTDQGHNLSSDETPTLNGLASQKKTDPKLGEFGMNGGFAATFPLLVNSPAIDAGDAAVGLTTDQRGVTRPSGAGIDLGAYEFGQAAFNLGGRVMEGTNPVAGVEMTAEAVSAETDSQGYYVFPNLAAGTYTVAPFDLSGVGFTPDSIAVTLSDNFTSANFTARPTLLESGDFTANGMFQLTVIGLPARYYVLEASTNLTSWRPVVTNLTDDFGEFEFTDTNTNFTSRFYRSRPR